MNRLVAETYQDSTVRRSYDSTGRVVRVDDSAVGAFSYEYDLAGQLLASVSPFGTVRYVRDALGRISRRQVVGQQAVTYTYDSVSNLVSVAMPQASASYSYNARNQPAAMSRMNGVGTQFTYDDAGRLLSIAHVRESSPLVSLNYTTDAAGQRTLIQNSGGQSLISQVATAEYDDGNRLRTRNLSSYNYDDSGNLIAQTDSSGTTSFAWDSRNRLVAVGSPNGQSASLVYDPAGNLVKQTDSGPRINVSRVFVLDALTNVALVSVSDGTSLDVLSGLSVDSHMAVVRPSGLVQYGLSDAINSTVGTVDQAGLMKSQIIYEPYGQTNTGSNDYPFQFTGRLPISNDLLYYRARCYDPVVGRFLSPDPIDVGVSDYTYADNNPISNIDPYGLQFGAALPGMPPGMPQPWPGYPDQGKLKPGVRTASCPVWIKPGPPSGSLLQRK